MVREQKPSSFCPHLCAVPRSVSLVLVDANSGLFIADVFFRLHFHFCAVSKKEMFEGDLDFYMWFSLCQDKKSKSLSRS